jgi:hypothetical protein
MADERRRRASSLPTFHTYRPMKTLSLLVLILAVGSAVSPANAGARQGDLFGYRLDSRYPLTSRTQTGMSGMWRYVYAENATTPETISEVTLLTTPKSLRIVAITGIRSFNDSESAWRFFNVMAPMLAAHYGMTWRDNRKRNGVEAILSSQYRLSLYVTRDQMGGATVFVSLTRTKMRDLAALARSELRGEVMRPQAQPFLRGF